jgi:hypothetical protein
MTPKFTSDIHFTPELTDELIECYKVALKSKAETFEFHGRTVLAAYAKYLIEYLCGQFNKPLPKFDR